MTIANTAKTLRFLCVVFGISMILLLISADYGTFKPWQAIDWLDVLGEGGASLLCIVWLGIILHSRPNGKVTALLVWGITLIYFALFQDFVDEIIKMTNEPLVLDVIENLPAPLGMIITTLGLYQWRQEQLILNESLVGKERYFREMTMFDRKTGLYSAAYMEDQVALELERGEYCSLLMLDIDEFDEFNSHYGRKEGDRLLRQLANLLVMNLREEDLVCRFAGDRFLALLPHCRHGQASRLSRQLLMSIEHLPFQANGETVYSTVSIGISCSEPDDTADSLFRRCHCALVKAKDQGKNTYQLSAVA